MEFLAFLLAAVVVFLLFRGRRKRRSGGTISGKAFVTDGDGLRVSGTEIRLAGLDARNSTSGQCIGTAIGSIRASASRAP